VRTQRDGENLGMTGTEAISSTRTGEQQADRREISWAHAFFDCDRQ